MIPAGCFTVLCRQSGWYRLLDFWRAKFLSSNDWNKLKCDSSDQITVFYFSEHQRTYSIAHGSHQLFITSDFFLGPQANFHSRFLIKDAEMSTPVLRSFAFNAVRLFPTIFTNAAMFNSFFGQSLFSFWVSSNSNLTILATFIRRLLLTFLDTFTFDNF